MSVCYGTWHNLSCIFSNSVQLVLFRLSNLRVRGCVKCQTEERRGKVRRTRARELFNFPRSQLGFFGLSAYGWRYQFYYYYFGQLSRSIRPFKPETDWLKQKEENQLNKRKKQCKASPLLLFLFLATARLARFYWLCVCVCLLVCLSVCLSHTMRAKLRTGHKRTVAMGWNRVKKEL